MVAFSKIAIVSLAGVDAVNKGKQQNWLGGAIRPVAAGFMSAVVGSAKDLDVRSEPFQALRAQHMDELSGLINSHEKMEKRFSEFMMQKYGAPTCSASQEQSDCAEGYAADPSDPKFLTFAYNVARAHENMLDNDGSTIYGITPLMDENQQEFRSRLGYKKPQGAVDDDRKPEDVLTLKSTTTKTSQDWRDKALTPVKDQGQCGSCWAFSTVQSMESDAILKGFYTQEDPFIGSTQELVSCDNKGMDEGCNGGLPSNAFEWFKKNGLDSASDYPYISGRTQITEDCLEKKPVGYLKVESDSARSFMGYGETEDMKDYIMERGPLSVAVAANDKWQTYIGGVLSLDECPESQVNHAVQAVALHLDDEGQKYWVVRNSWASSWGEDGFIRLAYGDNVCNIAADAYSVEVKQVDRKAPVSEDSKVTV